MTFRVTAESSDSMARRGILDTCHGQVRTPVFMPVGTRATVKTMRPDQLKKAGTQIILGNTYHLMLRPGLEIIGSAGGLHRFMDWQLPLLTDSGGYQVFSLSKLCEIRQDGVEFQSHIDGDTIFLGPREAMAAQRVLASDIAMVFDDCTAYPATREETELSLERTLRWAEISIAQQRAPGQLVFGIAQGGLYRNLREHAAASLTEMNFDGFAIGGVSVGEPEEDMLEVLDWTSPLLPDRLPRYLMGVGTPPQILRAIARGIDMFDCVLPTRVGRNGTAYTSDGLLHVKAGRFKSDFRPIEEACGCYTCRNFSRAYIRHLLNMKEILGLHLMSVHNLWFYLRLMDAAGKHIEQGTFSQFHDSFLENWQG